MAYRKRLPQPLACAQCGAPFLAARKGHVNCSNTCNTRAWRARRAADAGTESPEVAARSEPEAPSLRAPSQEPTSLVPTSAREAPAEPLGFFSTVAAAAMGNVVGNKLTDWWSPTQAAAPPPTSGWPTWPPAELLASTGPPLWVHDPRWAAPQLLTPVTHHEHRLYLCLEDQLTVVLYQYASGEWSYVRTPAELARFAATPPQGADRRRALQTQYVDVVAAPPAAADSAPAQALLVAAPTATGPAPSQE